MKLYIQIMAALCLIPISTALAIKEENFNLGDDITDIGTFGLLGKKNDARKREAWEEQRERNLDKQEARRERVGRSRYRDHRYDGQSKQESNRNYNDNYYKEKDSLEE